MILSDTTPKYTSKYTDKLVTASNHITEILMERLAKRDKRTLSWEFWKDNVWKKPYALACIQVSKVLNIYEEKAVLNALRKLEWCWSIGSPKLKQAILEEQSKLELQAVKAEVEKSETVKSVINTELPSSRPSFNKSKLDKLR